MALDYSIALLIVELAGADKFQPSTTTQAKPIRKQEEELL